MRHNVFVSYALMPDVHTALHMAGADAAGLITTAVREYIERHGHVACAQETQARVAMEGLGLQGTSAPQAQHRPPVAAPAPVFIHVLEPAPIEAPMPATSSAFAYSQLNDS